MERALLKRFVPSEQLPPGCVADFDVAKQLLRIDKEFYEHASPEVQRKLWRTQHNIVIEYRKAN